MEFLLTGIPAFIIAVIPLIVIHELGHYWAARACGVGVEAFSVGFGKELFGYTDRSGTRWRFSAIPLGGYVKMFGDANAASAGSVLMAELPPEVQAKALQNKSLLQRSFIVIAGPLANIILGILIFASVFMAWGKPEVSKEDANVLTGVVVGAPAEAAGFLPGDRIISMNGRNVQNFEHIAESVVIAKTKPIETVVLRDGETVTLTVTPQEIKPEGSPLPTYRIGIRGGRMEKVQVGPIGALQGGVEYTWDAVERFGRLVSMLFGGHLQRSDFGGVVKISAIAGAQVQASILNLVIFAGILSIQLAILNLLPIPVLDGGHLMFFLYEAIAGKPLPVRVQEAAFMFGFMLIIGVAVLLNVGDVFDLMGG